MPVVGVRVGNQEYHTLITHLTLTCGITGMQPVCVHLKNVKDYLINRPCRTDMQIVTFLLYRK